MIEFSFSAPAERLTKNMRLHWSPRANLTRVWRTAGFVAARNWALRTGVVLPLPPSILTVIFEVPDRRRRDADGPALTVAALQDGLVDAGFWPDDTPEFVAATGSVFEVAADRKRPQVTVRLTPMETT